MTGPVDRLVSDRVLYRSESPRPAEDSGTRPLDVNVLFTSMPGTAKALKRAADLARGLKARLRLLVAQVVPYAVPLEAPPVSVAFQEARFRKMAQSYDLETCVDMVLCRDADSVFLRYLPAHSVVVLAVPKFWWRTRERSLARRLRGLGHEVVTV